jgi:hypothetical protein
MNLCVYVDEPRDRMEFRDFNESLNNSGLLKRQYSVDLVSWFCTRDSGYLVLCRKSWNGQANVAVFTSMTQSKKTERKMKSDMTGYYQTATVPCICA